MALLDGHAPAGGKRILCGLDDSEPSRAALQYVLDSLARKETGDQVILFMAARETDRKLCYCLSLIPL